MPDDNRFAGLSEAVETDEPDEPEAAVEESDEGASAETAADDRATAVERDPTGSDTGADATATDAESAETDDPTAFPFDATEKKTVYVRPETIDDLEDARALVDAQLRTDHDVRDLTGREFYDAVFRLAAADTEGLIDEVLAAREE